MTTLKMLGSKLAESGTTCGLLLLRTHRNLMQNKREDISTHQRVLRQRWTSTSTSSNTNTTKTALENERSNSITTKYVFNAVTT